MNIKEIRYRIQNFMENEIFTPTLLDLAAVKDVQPELQLYLATLNCVGDTVKEFILKEFTQLNEKDLKCAVQLTVDKRTSKLLVEYFSEQIMHLHFTVSTYQLENLGTIIKNTKGVTLEHVYAYFEISQSSWDIVLEEVVRKLTKESIILIFCTALWNAKIDCPLDRDGKPSSIQFRYKESLRKLLPLLQVNKDYNVQFNKESLGADISIRRVSSRGHTNGGGRGHAG